MTTHSANDNILIIYHANCMDGAGALYATHKALKAVNPNANITCIPCNYDERGMLATKLHKSYASYDLPDSYYQLIYVVDFSFTPEDFTQLCLVADEVICIDHHKTACEELLASGVRETLPTNLHLILNVDNTNSGAVRCHTYFNDCKEGDPLDVPSVLRYIEDRDLWKFNLPSTHAVSAWLFANVDLSGNNISQTLSDVQYCHDTIETEPHRVIREGHLLLEQRATQTLAIATKCAVLHTHTGRNFMSVNCPSFLASDVAEELRKRHPTVDYFALWFLDNDCNVRISFRAGTKNVRNLAEQFGGGGHDKAAGAITGITSWLDYLDICDIQE